MMAVGGVDTYYDYDEQQWKYRRLGGGPVRERVALPEPRPADVDDRQAPSRRTSASPRSAAEITDR
jgi:hypothetical protein